MVGESSMIEYDPSIDKAVDLFRNMTKAEARAYQDGVNCFYEKGVEYDYISEGGILRRMSIHMLADDINNLPVICLHPPDISHEESKAEYRKLRFGINGQTGEMIDFFMDGFNKRQNNRKFFDKIVPYFGRIFNLSFLFYSEPEQLSGTTHSDGTPHRAHTFCYGSYIARIRVDDIDYLVRMTIQRGKNNPGLHYPRISELDIYKIPAKGTAYLREKSELKEAHGRNTDSKIERFFELSNEHRDELEKVLDHIDFSRTSIEIID